MDSPFQIVLIVVLTAFVIWRLVKHFVDPGVEKVTNDERVEIHRDGRFDRIAGPGRVTLLKRFETIERRHSVTEALHRYPISGLTIYDVPFGMTLECAWRLDPQSALPGDQDKQWKVLQDFQSGLLLRQIEACINRVVSHRVNALQQAQPVDPSEPAMRRIAAIVPGNQSLTNLLRAVQLDAARELCQIGIVLNQEMPITVCTLFLSRAVFSRETSDPGIDLRRYYPRLPNDVAVMLLAVDDVGSSADAATSASSAAQPSQVQSDEPDYYLNAADLAVLKVLDGT